MEGKLFHSQSMTVTLGLGAPLGLEGGERVSTAKVVDEEELTHKEMKRMDLGRSSYVEITVKQPTEECGNPKDVEV